MTDPGTQHKTYSTAIVMITGLIVENRFIWSAEVFPTTIRAKGLGVTLFGYFVGAITYTTPSALAF